MRLWIRRLLATAAVSFLAACGGGGDDNRPTDAGTLTVLQRLQADARFTTLVEAVNAAGLADRLKGAEALTLFAPTNEAFTVLLATLGAFQGTTAG